MIRIIPENFGSGITLDNIRFTKSGNDLIVSIAGTNDKVIIKDSNINPDNSIEQFIFQDGTIVDGSKFYELSVDNKHNVAYTDFSFSDKNSISPYIDRSYYDHGSVSSNFYFDANRNLVEETYYGETGEISSTRIYSYNEDGTLSTMDDGENQHSYTYSSGLRTDTITSKSDNSYAIISSDGNIKYKALPSRDLIAFLQDECKINILTTYDINQYQKDEKPKSIENLKENSIINFVSKSLTKDAQIYSGYIKITIDKQGNITSKIYPNLEI